MKPVLSSRRSWPSTLVLISLCASSALAQSPAVTALHPCVIAGEAENEAEVTELQALCAAEVSGRGIELVEAARVQAVLGKEPGGSCAASSKRTACLARLAAKTRASRALLLVVAPYAPVTRVSGLVVDARGRVLEEKKLELSRVLGRPVQTTLTGAIRSLLDTLSLSAVELAPLVADAPKATQPDSGPLAPPAVTAASPSPASPLTWKTPAAYVGAGASVVSFGLAALFLAQAGDRLDTLDSAYRNGAIPLPDRRGELSSLQDGASLRQTLAGVSAGAGLALLGASTYLWLSDRNPSLLAPRIALGAQGLNVRLALP